MDARMAFKRGTERAKVLLGVRLSGVQRAGRRCRIRVVTFPRLHLCPFMSTAHTCVL